MGPLVLSSDPSRRETTVPPTQLPPDCAQPGNKGRYLLGVLVVDPRRVRSSSRSSARVFVPTTSTPTTKKTAHRPSPSISAVPASIPNGPSVCCT